MPQYYIFYKPYQVLSQFSAEGNKKTLAHFFDGVSKDVYPVGRLDYDREGLLILTDDKALTNQLLHPFNAHKRTYYVQVEGEITLKALRQLQEGVTISIDGTAYRTKRAEAEILLFDVQLPERNPPIRVRKNIPDSWIALTLTEGKNRQVRRMTAAVGFPTLRLVRYSIGKINVDGMQPGSYKIMDEDAMLPLLGLKARKP